MGFNGSDLRIHCSETPALRFFPLTPLWKPDQLEVNVSTNDDQGEDCTEQDDQPCIHGTMDEATAL